MSRASEARIIRQKVMQTLQASQQQLYTQRVNVQVMRARQLHEQKLQSFTKTEQVNYGGQYPQYAYTPEQYAFYQQHGYWPSDTYSSSHENIPVHSGQSQAYTGVAHPPLPPSAPEPPKERKNLVPMKHNSQYNLNTLLANNILHSDYFKSLYEKNTFQQVVDEIYYKVNHVEPWMNKAGRKPSTAFCLLYKFFTMKLTVKQMNTLLNHRDSPYIRAIGFLYLRYTCPPDQLWSWLEPFIYDQEEFCPEQGSKRINTIGKYVENLLGSDLKYYGTLLPRIPKKIETSTQVNLLRSKKELASNTDANSNDLSKGTVVRARYSEDGKWYDARIEEPGRKPGSYWVTYLPEDEYGNQEEVEAKNLKVAKNPLSKRARETDEELKRIIQERERNSVATSGRDYAKPIPGIKSSLAVPIAKRHKTEADTLSAPRRTIEEVLEKQGRLGDISNDKKTQRNKEREALLSRYGNIAASSSEMKKEHRESRINM